MTSSDSEWYLISPRWWSDLPRYCRQHDFAVWEGVGKVQWATQKMWIACSLILHDTNVIRHENLMFFKGQSTAILYLLLQCDFKQGGQNPGEVRGGGQLYPSATLSSSDWCMRQNGRHSHSQCMMKKNPCPFLKSNDGRPDCNLSFYRTIVMT